MTNPSPITLDRVKIEAAHANIDGPTVARMIMEFQREFRGVYGDDVMASMLCAVGPLQSMIGLAIRNGHLALEALSRAAPSGSDMVLVPVEPTKAMIAAGYQANVFDAPEIIAKVWDAMLAATQPQGDR